MKMDETNIAILKHLRQGRKSFKKIAEQLSLSENTVRARVNKLIDEINSIRLQIYPGLYGAGWRNLSGQAVLGQNH